MRLSFCAATLLATMLRAPLLATVFPALPAAAATMQAVYTGTVYGSHDLTGSFGAGSTRDGATLDGQAFTATFRYDTARGLAFDDGAVQGVYGGPLAGFAYPVTQAALTINGVTLALALAGDYAAAEMTQSGVQDQTMHVARDLFTGDNFTGGNVAAGNTVTANALSLHLGSLDRSLGLPADLTQPFSATWDPQNARQYRHGYFVFDTHVAGSTDYSRYVSGFLAPARVVVTRVAPGMSPVPLPGGLGLLVLAVGGVAGVARRRA